MAASLADLEARVTRLEARQQRNDEDTEALMDTIVDARTEVRRLSVKVDVLQQDMTGLRQQVTGLTKRVDTMDGKVTTMQRGIDAIVAHLGLSVEPDNRDT